jgi:ketosteroid isomerase-like protein
MKSLLCAGIASCALALLVPMQHAFSEEEPSSPATEREVLQAVDKYRSAILKRDTAALEQIWADDYTFVNGAGEMLSKAQRLQNIKSGATSLDSVTQGDDVKVRIYRDTAVVTTRVRIKGQYSGKEAGGQYRSMLVWLKGPSGWQLIANQLTPLASK